jgi:hypothetical protein
MSLLPMTLSAALSAMRGPGYPTYRTVRPSADREAKPLTKYDLVALERARLKRERKLKR